MAVMVKVSEFTRTVVTLNPTDFPMQKGESWWIVSPNNGNAEFDAPIGSWTLWNEQVLGFSPGTMYEITDNEKDSGWITVGSKETCARMPYYVFARHFDAECFVRDTEYL